MPSQTDVSTARTWNFPSRTVVFLAELKANNTRDWFKQNKSEFEQAVKQPAEQYCALMANELLLLTGSSHTSKVFRIYRDVRFSKDKTPYNAHLHIGFYLESPCGPSPVWFFGLEPELLTFGAGIFAFEKSDLELYRQKVDGPDGKVLAKLLGNLEKDGVRIGKPELKRVPSGYDKAHENGENLRRKGLTVWSDSKNTDAVSRPGLIKSSTASFERLKPVVDWLNSLSAE